MRRFHMAENIASLVVGLEEDAALAAVGEALDSGTEPLDIVEQLRCGMSEVGRRFEAREYFLSELVMSAEIFKEAMALIEPRLTAGAGPFRGSLVIGTVKGDIHDIGKNIVASLLRCGGYEVFDIGVDVAPEAFVEKLKATGAGLLALSGLLTIGFDSMKETVDCLQGAGLRDTVKVIIGGGPVNEQVLKYAGADAWGRDVAEAVRLAERYLG